MQEVEIRFDEGREGIVPVGTYLVDAARRMGAAAGFDCSDDEGHLCKVKVTQGSELLSPSSDVESEQLSTDEKKQGVRLACYTKIEKAGVITAMVDKKKNPVADEKEKSEREEAYRKEFSELPLEKKIAELMQLEAIALGETFAFVINSPFKVFEKIGDVMAEFGFRKEEDEKRRARPAEAASPNGEKGGPKKKQAGKKKPAEEGPIN